MHPRKTWTSSFSRRNDMCLLRCIETILPSLKRGGSIDITMLRWTDGWIITCQCPLLKMSPVRHKATASSTDMRANQRRSLMTYCTFCILRGKLKTPRLSFLNSDWTSLSLQISTLRDIWSRLALWSLNAVLTMDASTLLDDLGRYDTCQQAFKKLHRSDEQSLLVGDEPYPHVYWLDSDAGDWANITRASSGGLSGHVYFYALTFQTDGRVVMAYILSSDRSTIHLMTYDEDTDQWTDAISIHHTDIPNYDTYDVFFPDG